MNMAVGAFLCLDQNQMRDYTECTIEDLYAKLANKITYKQYTSKKSTWSEIKTIIDSLNFIHQNSTEVKKIEIYTDCQSFCDLLNKRKEKLLKTNFITRTGKVLQNAGLYKELFFIAEKFQLHIFKVKGHHPKSNRVSLQEKIFSVLDKLSRRKLRSLLDV